MFKSLLSRLKPLSEHSALEPVTTDCRIQASLCTDKGCVREINQDVVRYVNPLQPTLLRQKGCLAVVCDGMGGRNSGDLASAMAADEIESAYYRARSDDVEKCLKKSFSRANKTIFRFAESNPQHRGMGTTATALVVRRDQAYFAHVGDSRLYLIRSRRIQKLSTDHSVVGEKVRQGMINENEAMADAESHILTRVLGTRRRIEIETGGPLPVECRDHFILCSDGLYNPVTDDELLAAVSAHAPSDTAGRLIDLAKSRGGYDNVSLILLAIGKTSEDDRRLSITRY